MAEHIDFVRRCAVCDRSIEPEDRAMSLHVRSRRSGGLSTTAHVECVRPLLRPEVAAVFNEDDIRRKRERRVPPAP
jgi:hypothetical protein